MSDSESSVERYLAKSIKRLGGITRKFVSPGHSGVADRICFLPDGKVFFVEVKAIDGVETSIQQRERKRMLKFGQDAIIVYGKSGVDNWLCSMSPKHIIENQ